MADDGAFDQQGFGVRLEWGLQGARALAPGVDVLVIVDVLSFSTAVSVAVERGAAVYPYPVRDAAAETYAAQLGAVLATSHRQPSLEQPYTLSPASLCRLPYGARLVLPSLNGSAIAALAAEWQAPILAGCLRNASAVAAAAWTPGRRVGLVAAGERWPDGSLRPCFEDLVGAGAIADALPEAKQSPEAAAAAAAFRALRDDLPAHLAACASGRELQLRGFAEDVRLAAALNASVRAPRLRDGAFQA